MLESLENNEVILLMYLAGELPPVDRQEVEQMLAADGGLRRELETLQIAQQLLVTGLTSLDQAEPLSNQAAATRRIGRAMRQHFADSAARAARNVAPPPAKLVVPWWAYPTSAAAAIFLAFIIWVISFNVAGHRVATRIIPPSGDSVSPAPMPTTGPSDTDPKTAQLAQEIENSFGPSTEKEDNQMFALRADPQAAPWSDAE